MKLTEFLPLDNIRVGVEVSGKKKALEQVGQLVADYACRHALEEQAVCPIACFSNLFKREKLGSTAINHGVALPHAKLPQESEVLNKPVAVFLQLSEPIDYEATDNKEVDLIYAILFPEQCCATYKSYLPEIAEKLSDKHLLKLLRSAESAEDIWHILDTH